MNNRTSPRQIATLLSVTRIQRQLSEGELETARSHETQMHDAAENANREALASEKLWLAQCSGQRLDLEMQAICGRALIGAVQQAERADGRLSGARADTAAREQQLRIDDARMRSTEQQFARANRTKRRQLEEHRLAALSERVTYSWWQR